MMKDKLSKLRNKIETQPYAVVTQTKPKSFPIYHLNIKSEVDCDAIVTFLLEEKPNLESKKGKPTSNFWRLLDVIKAWHSDYTPNDYTNKDFVKLCEVIKNKVEQIFPDYSYVIDHLWFVVYSNKDTAKVHDHGTTDIAIVFYPKVAENSSPLSIVNESGDIDIEIHEGSLLIFPGDVLHYVKPSSHVGERIAISMNLHRDKKIRTKKFMELE